MTATTLNRHLVTLDSLAADLHGGTVLGPQDHLLILPAIAVSATDGHGLVSALVTVDALRCFIAAWTGNDRNGDYGQLRAGVDGITIEYADADPEFLPWATEAEVVWLSTWSLTDVTAILGETP